MAGWTFGRRLLQLGNPKLEVILDPPTLTAGQPAALEVRVLGNANLLHDWRLTLVIRQEMCIKERRSSSFEVEELHRVTIAVGEQAPPHDALLIKIPADVWPRYAIDDVEHICYLEAKARIDRWPDLHDEVRLNVRPATRTL
ncbi:MAG: hypothetical protein AAGD32_00030 [Planctomycetota bacterium]